MPNRSYSRPFFAHAKSLLNPNTSFSQGERELCQGKNNQAIFFIVQRTRIKIPNPLFELRSLSNLFFFFFFATHQTTRDEISER